MVHAIMDIAIATIVLVTFTVVPVTRMDTIGLVIITLATILGIGPIATILDIVRTATFVAVGEGWAGLASVNSDSPWLPRPVGLLRHPAEQYVPSTDAVSPRRTRSPKSAVRK